MSAPPDKAGATTATRLLVLDFTAESTAAAPLLPTVTSLVTTELSRWPDIDAITNADVRRLLELEGNRQQTGCDDTSCLAEVAGAMGARLVVFGSVGNLAADTTVTLNLFDSTTATSVGREFVQVTSPAALPAAIAPAVRRLLSRTATTLSWTVPPEPTSTTTAAAPVVEKSPLPLVLTGVGIGAFVVGGAVAGFGLAPLVQWSGARAAYFEEKSASRYDTAAAHAADWNNAGVFAAGIGGAVAVVGIVTTIVGIAGLSAGEN